MISRAKKNLTYTLEQRYGGLHEKTAHTLFYTLVLQLMAILQMLNGIH